MPDDLLHCPTSCLPSDPTMFWLPSDPTMSCLPSDPTCTPLPSRTISGFVETMVQEMHSPTALSNNEMRLHLHDHQDHSPQGMLKQWYDKWPPPRPSTSMFSELVETIVRAIHSPTVINNDSLETYRYNGMKACWTKRHSNIRRWHVNNPNDLL